MAASNTRFTQNSLGQSKTPIDSDHGIYRDLRNVVAKYPFERSHRFSVIQPNSGCRDYSRLSCDGGRVARAYCQDRGRMLALAGIAAFSADAEMIRRRPIQQYHCSLCAGLFPQGERLWVQFAPRSAPRCERGSSL